MRFHKILVPIDFSDHSLEALRMASIFAAETGAKLLMVHVWQPAPPLADGIAWGEVYAEQGDEAKRELNDIEPYRLDVECERIVLVGDAASEIVRVAEEQRVDMIVIGTHGRTGLTRLVLGSVAEHVMRRATCPVLTCKLVVAEKGHAEATHS